MDEDIKHICRVVGISRENRQRMVHYGICKVDSLENLEVRIVNEELPLLPEDIKEKLLVVVIWRKQNPHEKISQLFDEDVFGAFFF